MLSLKPLAGPTAILLGAAALCAQTFFPPPPTPPENPVTQAKALLGMALFWEEQLSSTDTVACGTCHVFSHGGCDPRTATSLHPGLDGVFGTPDDRHGSPGVAAVDAARRPLHGGAFGLRAQVTRRRAPSVVNAAYPESLFADGRATAGVFLDPVGGSVVATGPVALENLIVQPPVDPAEMGHRGRTWTEVAAKLETAQPLRLASALPTRLQAFVAGRSYPQLFEAAFGSPDVTPARTILAIATYIRTLIADQTPFDLYLAHQRALTPQQQAGLALFGLPRNGAQACAACHSDLDGSSHTRGPVLASGYYQLQQIFHNIGVSPIAADPGRRLVTGLARDDGVFRVAGLRNVALGGPYFHDGSQPDLRGVVEFYDRGGDFHVNQAAGIQPRGYSQTEKDALVALLESLTDPRVRDELPPFDRPRLGTENGKSPRFYAHATAAGNGVEPRAAVPVTATTGATLVQAVEHASPAAIGLLLLDTVAIETGWEVQGLRLTIALSPSLFAHVAGVVAPDGTLVTTTTIPADPALQGATFFGQWLVTDPTNPLGLASSNAWRIRVN